MLSSSRSFSHSNGVNSARADQVDALMWASSLLHKGVASLILHFAPMIFHLPFSLKCISFLQYYVSWHQLNCACRFIIVPLLSVCFTVGLVLGLNISLFEVLLQLFHISGDTTVTCICTYCGEEKSTGDKSGLSTNDR